MDIKQSSLSYLYHLKKFGRDERNGRQGGGLRGGGEESGVRGGMGRGRAVMGGIWRFEERRGERKQLGQGGGLNGGGEGEMGEHGIQWARRKLTWTWGRRVEGNGISKEEMVMQVRKERKDELDKERKVKEDKSKWEKSTKIEGRTRQTGLSQAVIALNESSE